MIEYDQDPTLPKHKLMEAETERLFAYDEATHYDGKDYEPEFEPEIDFDELYLMPEEEE